MANVLPEKLMGAIAAGKETMLGRSRPSSQHLTFGKKNGGTIFSRFFNGDEAALLNDLRIDRGVFNIPLNIAEVLHIQTRGRRSLIHSRREQLLFIGVFRCLETSVVSLLESPRIKSVREVHRVALRVALLYHERLKDPFMVIPHQQLPGSFLSPVPRGWPIIIDLNLFCGL